MFKTTVYLDADTALLLRQIAEKQERPQAEVIRKALSRYTKEEYRRPQPLGLGKYHSGRADVSERAHELFRKRFDNDGGVNR